MSESTQPQVVVIISANSEWQVVRGLFPDATEHRSPLGGWFVAQMDVGHRRLSVRFFHGGWGKIAAAASAQFVIDRWFPDLLVNLGTCGGFEGEIVKGAIILVERTVVYDIINQMGSTESAIAHYTTDLDLSWLGENMPHGVRRTLIVSGDRDLLVEDIPGLKAQYGAVAGDWESGAIAYVAARNGVRCLILRGVSDLVGEGGSEAYVDKAVFLEGATEVLKRLVEALPAWIERAV